MADNAAGDRIDITVDGPDGIVRLRLKFGASMAKLKKKYANYMGYNVNSFRLIFNECCVNDEDTPETLEMEDGDVIEVRHDQMEAQ